MWVYITRHHSCKGGRGGHVLGCVCLMSGHRPLRGMEYHSLGLNVTPMGYGYHSLVEEGSMTRKSKVKGKSTECLVLVIIWERVEAYEDARTGS